MFDVVFRGILVPLEGLNILKVFNSSISASKLSCQDANFSQTLKTTWNPIG